MSLTTKQREALQALADVMQEHGIQLESNWYPITVFVGGHTYPDDFALMIDTLDIDIYLTDKTITKLLQEQE